MKQVRDMTVEERIWELTGGDPAKIQHLMKYILSRLPLKPK